MLDCFVFERQVLGRQFLKCLEFVSVDVRAFVLLEAIEKKPSVSEVRGDEGPGPSALSPAGEGDPHSEHARLAPYGMI